MKQYILIRTDKKFPIGKMLAHAAHNAIAAGLDFKSDKQLKQFVGWKKEGMKKVVVDGGSSPEIKVYIAQAEREEIPNSYIRDHNTGVRFCAAIGPVTDEEALHLGLADLVLYR